MYLLGYDIGSSSVRLHWWMPKQERLWHRIFSQKQRCPCRRNKPVGPNKTGDVVEEPEAGQCFGIDPVENRSTGYQSHRHFLADARPGDG